LNGELFPVEAMITFIPLHGKQILFTVRRDITKRKEDQEAVMKAQEELERRVQDRTADLIEINRQLREEIESRRRIEEELSRSRAELRTLSEHIQSAREEERKRIAQEVHDELGQVLSALKIDVTCLENSLFQKQSVLADEAHAIAARIDQAVQNVRKICTELRPAILDHFGVGAAMEWQAAEFQKRTGIVCRCRVDPEASVLQPDLSSALFRILQEALTNVLRHASATEVKVVLQRKRGNYVLTVEDNGRGIRQEKIYSSKSFGLMGMRERVRFWGGDMTVEGNPGTGTRLTVSIPIENGV